MSGHESPTPAPSKLNGKNGPSPLQNIVGVSRDVATAVQGVLVTFPVAVALAPFEYASLANEKAFGALHLASKNIKERIAGFRNRVANLLKPGSGGRPMAIAH